MPQDDDASGELLAQVSRMTELARGGEWQRIESLAREVDAMIGGLPADRHRDALLATRAGIQRVLTIATTARREIGDKLTAIRHGRKATASYRATGTLRASR